MPKLVRISLWALGVIALLILSLALYLRNADLSVYEDEIESYLSATIGHELTIDGRFELQVRGLTRLTAEGITVTNADWPSERPLVTLGHLSVALDLWSLVAGPMIIDELEIRDIGINLERDAEGRGNWMTGRAPQDGGAEFDTRRIAFRDVNVERVQLVYLDSERPRAIDLAVDFLHVRPDETELLDLDLQGTINDLPLWADGKLGPWQNLLDGRDLTADLDLTLGQVRLGVTGSAEDIEALEGIEAEFSLTGPAIERVTGRLGLAPFAQGEFQVDGRLRKLDAGSQVRVEGALGAIELLANGTLDSLRRPESTRFDFVVSGPDAKYVAELLGVNGVPQVPFQLTGDLQRQRERRTFTGTRAQLGENAIAIDGWLETVAAATDLDLSIDAAGPDFSVFAPFIGIEQLPGLPFDIGGRIRKAGADWQVDDVAGFVGANRIEASGALAAGEATEIVIRASGPDNTVLQALTGLHGLPPRPFDIGARIRPHRAGIRLDEATAVFGEYRIDVVGVVGTTEGLVGTALDVTASGPELRDVALLTGVPYLPGGAFEIGANLEIDRNQLVLRDASAVVGELEASASGTVGLGAAGGEFDLVVAANGPDAAGLAGFDWLQAFAGDPVSVTGRIRHRRDDYDLESVAITVGDVEASLGGRLSIEPLSNDSDLEFDVTGPDMDRFVSALGLEVFFPAKPFAIAGRFDGTPSGFAMHNFVASIGGNRIDGVLSADLRDKPDVTGTFSSGYLDLSERLEQIQAQAEGPDDGAPTDNEFYFSDTLLDTAWLQSADIDVKASVDRLQTNYALFNDLRLGVQLRDGALSLAPLAFRESEGSLDAELTLAPLNGEYGLTANVIIDNVRLGMLGADDSDRTLRPPINGRLELRGAGKSIHDIMAASKGTLSVRQGSGRILNRESRLFGDLILEVVRTLNPLRTEDQYRRLDCGIYDVDIADGVATIREFAVQTDTLTALASGKIRFEDESLDIAVRAKPREGIGISIAGLTASFLKIGGTLKSPRLNLDAKGTATTTGVAVATGGLSLLARGLADRLTAEADICSPQESKDGDQASDKR